MFSSYNQSINNIVFSQRFYFNNYQYYNDYEKIDHKYRDDLSKVYFRLNRKSKGTIFYQWSYDQSLKSKEQPNNNNKMEVQSNSDKLSENKKSIVGQREKRQRQLGIERLLAQVMDTFYQQNFSDIKTDEESKKQLYQFVHLKYINRLTQKNHQIMDEQSSFPSYQQNEIDVLNQILIKESNEKQFYYEAIQKMNSFAKDEDQIFLQRWNAFQNYGFYYLDHKLIKKQNNRNYKQQLKRLYLFATKVRFIVQRTISCEYMNSLFLNLPNLKKLTRIFHPLTLGLSYTNKFFQQKNGFKVKPKIVFLNLDGRQTPFNLRYARNMGENFMYVSVFKEPNYHYKKNQKMEYEFQSDYDTNFSNISDNYARLLINEAYPSEGLFTGNQQKFINKSKMLLFPLNNDYLRKQYYKGLNGNLKSDFNNHTKSFPTLQTSNDIFFLFQTVILEQIRSFNPSFIIVSYNGYLNINQDHWNEIVKNLTIIADHKVSLFMDFIDRLGGKHKKYDEDQDDEDDDEDINEDENQQPQEDNAQQDDLDQFKVRNIQVIQEFINKYIPFKNVWPRLEHERILNNMLMFLKVSSGIYSMQTRLLLFPYFKYSLGDRYSYLECLGQGKQMHGTMSKYAPKTLRSEQLKQLYNNQGRFELKQNRKQNQSYERLIDSVILEFLGQNRKQNFGSNYKLYYRLQEVLEEQEYQNILKYGTEEDNPQYSATISNSISLENRHQIIMHEYLKDMKRKLLLQNLQTYRYRKAFCHEEDFDSHQQSLAQKVKCYKFYLYEDDSEQISFQKYTQIIFDTKRSKVYIINYKAIDQRHLILYGNLIPSTFQKKFSIKVQIAKQSENQLQSPIHSLFDSNNKQSIYHNLQSTTEESLNGQQHSLLLKKDLLFVNYSHCFVKNKLYLFWPQKWSIKDEIRYKLLGMKYKPENVNLMVKVEFTTQNQCVYQTLQLKQNQKNYVHPRIGCSSYEILTQEDQFFIFGGIHDNQNDFFDIGEGIYHLQIKDNKNFIVKALPKIKQKNIKQSSVSVMSIMRKNLSFTIRLRPKMHYRIQRFVDTNSNSQQNKLIISGGFGRDWTNFFNCFSYESYLFNTNTKLIETKQIHNRRLVKLPKPIEINKVGKFYMITNNQNTQQVEQNFSDLPKDLFAYEYKSQRTSLHPSMISRQNRQSMNSQSSNSMNSSNIMFKYFQNRQVCSFIDEKHRTFEFKFQAKKIYLFGFNRTIRQSIYTKFWSPELYIVDGNQSNIVHISLKTQKNFNYNISNFLMPREEDIVSLCLDQDKLYVLSSSPVIHSMDYPNNKYVLYEGNLSNMTDVVNKHELQMYQKFEFKKQKQSMLKYKTLYAFDQKIYLFGGLATIQDPSMSTLSNQSAMDLQNKSNKVSYRQDYVIQKQKNKFVLKIRKVQSGKDSVQMISPAVIKFNELLYFYSIEMTQTMIKKQGPFPEIKENYNLKIEVFSSESSLQGKIMSQIMKFYAYDPVNKCIIRIIPRLDEPKFVSIVKHEPFNLSKFRQYLQKVTIRLNKRLSQSELKQQKESQLTSKCLILLREKNEQLLIEALLMHDKFFKELIDCIKPQINQKQRNIEQEQLIKDLKICYSMVNKLILEKLIQQARIQQSNRQQTMSNQDSVIEGGSYENSNNSSNQNMRKQKLVERLQKLTLNVEDNMVEYRFIVEDPKSSRKIRYIAIGSLANLQELRFFRIRFKHDVSLSLNKTNQDGFYYHPTINSCEQIDLNDRFCQYDLMTNEDIRNESKSYRQSKLHCQLKI